MRAENILEFIHMLGVLFCVAILLGAVSLAATTILMVYKSPQDACGNRYPGAAQEDIKDPNPFCKPDDQRRD